MPSDKCLWFFYLDLEIRVKMIENGRLWWAVVPSVEMSAMVAYWYCDYYMDLWMQKYQIRSDILLVNHI